MPQEWGRNGTQGVAALTRSLPPWAIGVAGTFLVFIAYFLSARLGLFLLTQPDGVAVFWPAAGVSAGLLIGLGRPAGLPVAIGVAAATVAANLIGDRNVWSSIVFAFCNVIEAVVVALLIERYFGSSFELNQLRRVIGFISAAIIGCCVSGIGGTIGYLLFHSSGAPAWTIWQHWFASDLIGLISVAPFLIGLATAARDAPTPKEIAEGVAGLAILAAICSLFIFLPYAPWDDVAMASTFPLLVWLGARCKPVFSAAAALVIALTIVFLAIWQVNFLGIDANASIEYRVLTAQVIILSSVLCALVLGALFSERRAHFALVQLANQSKSAFLVAASHDLRQPLQTLKILQETLLDQIEDRAARPSIIAMGRSLETMSDMLASLLDINQLESGIIRPVQTDFSVNDVFDSLAADFSESLKQKGLQCKFIRSSLAIRSDPRMLREIIRNLLSNAVRYTEKGRILVGCRRAGGNVRIEVWDTGVGIMGEYLPRIFEAYFKGPQTGPGGFGLGLAIVQRLGNMLGHQIDVRSTPGKGSAFSITVPIGFVNAQASPVPSLPAVISDSTGARTILLIEDEITVRVALERWLELKGLDVVSVANGSEALALVNGKSKRFDLVLSDYNIPGQMNGIDSINALRAAHGRKIPAIVLTGDTRDGVTQSIAKHDVGIAIKPLKMDDLMALINGQLAAGEAYKVNG